ncbi:adenylate/guanylate cyclase domain-containing protein [Agaribacter marinus]|nr:adenylate/guanylate cyclase domain-containing protein [Agaribacter marinus]
MEETNVSNRVAHSPSQYTQFTRHQILSRIILILCSIVSIQSLKLAWFNEHHTHLVNMLIHLVGFLACWALLQQGLFKIARTLLFSLYISYIGVACYLWQLNLNLQYFYLLAIFIASLLYKKHESNEFYCVLALLLSCFVYFHLSVDPLSTNKPNLVHLAAINSFTLMLSCVACAFHLRFMINANWQSLQQHNNQRKYIVDKLIPISFQSGLSELSGAAKPSLDAPTTSNMQANYCSVGYIDFVNSTNLIHSIGEQKALTHFQQLFVAFDHETQKYNAHRVKTNGDQYIFVIGLNQNIDDGTNCKTQAIDACKLSAALQGIVNSSPYYPDLNCRIGIGSGIIYAGVINPAHPNFDIWGETVIRAARLEAYAQAGEVLVDKNTHQLSESDIKFNALNKVELKGLGLTEFSSFAHSE